MRKEVLHPSKCRAEIPLTRKGWEAFAEAASLVRKPAMAKYLSAAEAKKIRQKFVMLGRAIQKKKRESSTTRNRKW